MYDFILNMWHITQELALWLLIGCAVAGVMHAFLPANFIHRHFGKPGLGNIVKASLLGVPLPLCSCGVIPAAIGLKKDGASDAAAVGFLVSTPQTGVDSIAVSGAFLGWPFALFKVLSALVTGVIAGVVVLLTGRPRVETAETKRREEPPASGGFWRKLYEAGDFALNDLLAGFAVWVFVGIVISAAITTALPAGYLADSAIATGLTGILLMLVISLPMYVCATGSVPVAAALVAAGMPTGAALVFLMAGPATNAATLGAVLKAFGKRVTTIYVSVIAIGSVICGLLYETVFGDLRATRDMVHDGHSALHVISGLFLIGFFIFLLGKNLHRRVTPALEDTGSARSSGCCSGCAGEQ
ncbi:MAG: permease [Lentisphaeria bacterium]|nr:permease [Lentisphaeria bacterium]